LDELTANDGRTKQSLAVVNKMTIDNPNKKILLPAGLKESGQLFKKVCGIGDYFRMAGEIQLPVGDPFAEEDDYIVDFLIYFHVIQFQDFIPEVCV
jgi:hypothetical protein